MAAAQEIGDDNDELKKQIKPQMIKMGLEVRLHEEIWHSLSPNWRIGISFINLIHFKVTALWTLSRRKAYWCDGCLFNKVGHKQVVYYSNLLVLLGWSKAAVHRAQCERVQCCHNTALALCTVVALYNTVVSCVRVGQWSVVSYRLVLNVCGVWSCCIVKGTNACVHNACVLATVCHAPSLVWT